MRVKYAMVIDSSKCFNCKACIISCQLANGVPSGSYRNWIKTTADGNRTKAHFQPGNCMHCDNPTCVDACPTSATYKDEKDGTVKINAKLCINCGSCIPACPYGARYSHPEKLIVDKCNFCEERRIRGESIACVHVCPTQARRFGNIFDSENEVFHLLKNNKTVRVINQKVDTRPNIYYISKTAPLNWPIEPKAPTPIRLWRDIADPLVKAFVGLTGLGVLIMLGKQLLFSDEPPAFTQTLEEEDAHGQNND